jgi:hypothetical protein
MVGFDIGSKSLTFDSKRTLTCYYRMLCIMSTNINIALIRCDKCVLTPRKSGEGKERDECEILITIPLIEKDLCVATC